VVGDDCGELGSFVGWGDFCVLRCLFVWVGELC